MKVNTSENERKVNKVTIYSKENVKQLHETSVNLKQCQLLLLKTFAKQF